MTAHNEKNEIHLFAESLYWVFFSIRSNSFMSPQIKKKKKEKRSKQKSRKKWRQGIISTGAVNYRDSEGGGGRWSSKRTVKERRKKKERRLE